MGAVASENSLVTDQPWRFRPGQSGNPGGRPRGLAVLIREGTAEGADLVAFMLDIFHGKSPTGGRPPALRLRIDAATWLADRGFGKPVQQLEVGGPDGEPMRVLIEYADGAQDDGAGYPAA